MSVQGELKEWRRGEFGLHATAFLPWTVVSFGNSDHGCTMLNAMKMNTNLNIYT